MKNIIYNLIFLISVVLPILSYGQATRVTLSQLAQSGATDGQFVKWNNSTLSWEAGTVASSGGTVTSVGLSLPSIFTVTVSPITSSGTLTATLANQNANLVFAGPSTGAAAAPTFRSLVAADIPSLPYVPTSRTLTINGTAQDLSVDRSWSVGTVTQLSAAIGTTGTDIGYTIANATTTPLLTINIPTASSSARGALSNTDWSTFNSKQAAITLTTTGSSGSATFISNVLNVPTYTLAGLGGISLTALSATAPLNYNNTTGAFSITQSSSSTNGFLSSTDWVTFNNKQSTITLTTTGTSGAATFSANTLNIPQYQAAGSYVPTSRTLTINGTALDLSANRSWSVGTVTSVAALTLGTTGTDVSSSVSNGTTTPVITLNIPTASSTNRGALSSADWSTFNNKQNAITLTTTGNSGAATFVSNTLNIPNYTLTGLGGFTNPMTALGDMIYGGTSGVPTRLAGNTTNNVYYLSQLGTGTASNAPTWRSISGNEISGAALTKTDDTNVTLTLGGFSSTSLLRAASLTLGWTGQLAINRGGTGLSSLGSANQYLRVNSGATALEYATFPTIITDHGALTGLGDDDHTQYALLGGRGSGQTLRGGTSGSATLQLSSTSNASKGRIELAFDGGDVWIGGASAASTLRLYNAGGANYTGLVAGAQTSDITYTLPTTGGTSGQFLSTNGSGTLSWATGATISGTTNRIPYFNSSTTLGNSGLTWDNTNSRLGINVIAPSATLQVGGTSDNSGTYSLYITNQSGDKVINFDNSGKVGINVANPSTTLHFNGSMSRKAPIRIGVATSYTVLDDDSWIIVTGSSTVTITLPTASSFQGREIMIKNVSATSVISNASNVVAITTNINSNPPTTTTDILPATAGKWATLVSTQGGGGGWYWAIMQAN